MVLNRENAPENNNSLKDRNHSSEVNQIKR